MKVDHKILLKILLLVNVFILTTILAACTSNTIPSQLTSTPLSESPVNTLRLANGNWPPYNSQDLPHAGCDSWVIEEAFSLQGIEIEYEFFPWARSYNLSATGVFDGTLAWDDTPEHREDHYVSAEPTSTQEWVFFYKIDRPFVYNSMSDLAGKIIGITSGYVYSDAIKEMRQNETATFHENSSDEENFRMLLAGRIDVFPMERRVGRYLLSTHFLTDEQTQIGETKNSFSEFKTYLLLSKAIPGNQQMMIKFDEGFQQLVESGRYVEIIDQCQP